MERADTRSNRKIARLDVYKFDGELHARVHS
jgi:hypothetical protein